MDISPGDIVISVVVVLLIVDEIGLPKELLLGVLELANHGCKLAVFLVRVWSLGDLFPSSLEFRSSKFSSLL